VKIILVESVNHLGRSGEVVAVKAGYARNYLIPNNLAMLADANNMAVLESRKAEIDAREKENKDAAVKLQAVIEALSLSIKVETNEENQLFGSLGVNDVAKLLAAEGVTVNKRDVILPQGQILALGEHPVEIICHVDVVAKITLNVTKQG